MGLRIDRHRAARHVVKLLEHHGRPRHLPMLDAARMSAVRADELLRRQSARRAVFDLRSGLSHDPARPLVWRPGGYGPAAPLWHAGDDEAIDPRWDELAALLRALLQDLWPAPPPDLAGHPLAGHPLIGHTTAGEAHLPHLVVASGVRGLVRAASTPPEVTLERPRELTGTALGSRSDASLIALAFAPASGAALELEPASAIHGALFDAMPEACFVTWAATGARIAAPGGEPEAAALAADLMQVLAGVETSDGARLAIGAGVSGAADAYSDMEVLARRAEAAAAGSLAAGDHGVVTATWPRSRGAARAAVCRLYQRTSNRRRPLLLLAASTALAVVPSFVLYSILGALGFNLAGIMLWLVFAALAFTALINYSEAFTAFDPPGVPAEPARWPAMTVVVSGYLVNEVDLIVDTVRALLRQDYPGRLEVIVAHNGPSVPEVEAELAGLAVEDPRLSILAVAGSTSKAQNINAALDVAGGEVVGIFDADHRPAPGALRRAACWLSDATGVDVVQGHCSVRNGEDGWLQRMVAIEFEAIYAVGHPGRAALHQFAVFGGTNGFWRTELLRRVRLRPDMLTEDIDASVRAVLSGARMVSDPGLVSYELAPATRRALWNQRIRWAQGWSQVSRKYWRFWLTTPGLSLRQRFGGLWVTVWREGYSWLSAQMVPVLCYQTFVRHQRHIHWFLLFFCVSTLFTSAVGPMQALFARRLSVPHLREPGTGWWWWTYLLFLGAPYGEWRTAVCRAAHLREALGDRGWVVTPRTATQETAAFVGREAANRGVAA